MSSRPPRRFSSRKLRSTGVASPSPVDRDPTGLVPRCLRGETGAWEEFLERYGRLVYSTILKVGLPAEEQEAAFQETIMAVFRRLDQLRDPDHLVSWIVGIAWRQSVNRIRVRSREQRVEEVDDQVLSRSLDPPEDHAPPDEILLGLERAQQARAALDSLPERCRRLLGYFFYMDPPPDYCEIARREEIPIGSLGPTRVRCLEKLRIYFVERGWV